MFHIITLLFIVNDVAFLLGGKTGDTIDDGGDTIKGSLNFSLEHTFLNKLS